MQALVSRKLKTRAKDAIDVACALNAQFNR